MKLVEQELHKESPLLYQVGIATILPNQTATQKQCSTAKAHFVFCHKIVDQAGMYFEGSS